VHLSGHIVNGLRGGVIEEVSKILALSRTTHMALARASQVGRRSSKALISA